jgi:hypothetical protein
MDSGWAVAATNRTHSEVSELGAEKRTAVSELVDQLHHAWLKANDAWVCESWASGDDGASGRGDLTPAVTLDAHSAGVQKDGLIGDVVASGEVKDATLMGG